MSNRLPISVGGSGKDPPFVRTVGGLVSGVDAFLSARDPGGSDPGHVWIGWSGAEVGTAQRANLRARAWEAHRALPVFFGGAEAERFYEGFCNRTIWPLFHYFPSFVSFGEGEWSAYRAVNERFCDAVLEILEPGDAVWIHDYHLMLLPQMLRRRSPSTPSVFFLHVPFPAFEVFRVLPDEWARSLLEGMLGADVVGVHTYDYARHLLRSVERFLGVDHHAGVVTVGGRRVGIDAFPIGIDFRRFAGSADDPAVGSEREELRKALGGRRAVLSVDRLDYTKGVINRLRAFEAFLGQNDSWRGRVSLVAVVVPSRTGIESYRRMKTQIEEAVGRVNGRFGSVGWTPVLYQYRALDFARLAALYAACDVALVTPLRDGMNLIAKEYLAARADGSGVLVLSETAGAARELGEACLVNPYHVEGLASAIRVALEMPLEEQRRRNQVMRTRLSRYDVVRWGDEQFARMDRMLDASRRFQVRLLSAEAREEAKAAWRTASRRLLLLDYDGTLVPFTDDPAAARPDRALLALLGRLAEDPVNRVVLVSGRDAPTLERWFDGMPVALVAEHGARRRDPGGEWSRPATSPLEWMQEIVTVMEVFADRLPGSLVERKEVSVAWHYRAADSELGPVRARELVETLKGVKSPSTFSVLLGKKVVEVRPAGSTKGNAAAHWITRSRPDFVLAAGDDATDEDLFAALPSSALSIRIGLEDSLARYNLESCEPFRSFLLELVESTRDFAVPATARDA